MFAPLPSADPTSIGSMVTVPVTLTASAALGTNVNGASVPLLSQENWTMPSGSDWSWNRFPASFAVYVFAPATVSPHRTTMSSSLLLSHVTWQLTIWQEMSMGDPDFADGQRAGSELAHYRGHGRSFAQNELLGSARRAGGLRSRRARTCTGVEIPRPEPLSRRGRYRPLSTTSSSDRDERARVAGRQRDDDIEGVLPDAGVDPRCGRPHRPGVERGRSCPAAPEVPGDGDVPAVDDGGQG